MYRLAILTISSSGARGEREDTGGQAIRDKLPPPDYEEVRYEVVADDADTITGRISEWADSGRGGPDRQHGRDRDGSAGRYA